MMDDAIADDAKLKQVFGTKWTQAKANYGKAKAALATLKGKIDTNVHTDYNRDDDQVSLGGWAKLRRRRWCTSTPTWRRPRTRSTSAITILHECAHLASGSIEDDGGYYPRERRQAAPAGRR